jgi:hypothetical protein
VPIRSKGKRSVKTFSITEKCNRLRYFDVNFYQWIKIGLAHALLLRADAGIFLSRYLWSP